jgi:hypothetical protein
LQVFITLVLAGGEQGVASPSSAFYAEIRIRTKNRLPARPVFLPTTAKIAQKSVLNSAFWCFNGNLAALSLLTSNDRHFVVIITGHASGN